MNKSIKARKYNSTALQELFDEITPLEMEQTKVKMQLAIRIEDLMRSKKWNKSQFAEKVGKHSSEITKWLSGTQNFTTDVLTEIAFAFEIDISVLMGKKQIEVIYRKEIVVKSVVAQPSIILTTPIEGTSGNTRKLLSSNQQSTLPYSKTYQA
jgi:transcriptional regulator with XRE-family HTH domain